MEDKEVVVIQNLPKRGASVNYTGQIKITVEDPQINSKQSFSHFTYNIVGVDQNGPFSVRRRYSDFDLLRKRMMQRWIGIYIPPISGKRAQNNPMYVLKFFQSNTNEAKYAETRKRFLRYFCQGIAIRPYLYYCQIFQLFLRGGPDFETILSNIPNKEYSFILNAYQENFNLLLDQYKPLDLGALLNTNEKHYTSLKQSENILQAICQKVYKATQNREQFNIQFNNVMMKSLPEYEEKCMLNHLNKKREELILTQNEKHLQEMERVKQINTINPLEQFLQMIMYEIREIKSFMEAIEGRREAEKRKCQLNEKIAERQNEKNKLESGSFSLKSFFKGGSKQLQANEMTVKIEIMKNELNCIDKMITIMIVNCNYELQQFRKRRGKEYAQMFKKVAEQEMAEINAYEGLLAIPLAVLS